MSNLKPFDLQAALSGKTVMLRDGRKAYVRHHETELPVAENMRLIGFSVTGCRAAWCEDGSYYTGCGISDSDIIGMYPETRVINGFEVPAPETKKPALDTKYYTPLLTNHCFAVGRNWEDDGFDNRSLQRGLVFLSVQDAIATAKAMLGIDPNTKAMPDIGPYSETEL